MVVASLGTKLEMATRALVNTRGVPLVSGEAKGGTAKKVLVNATGRPLVGGEAKGEVRNDKTSTNNGSKMKRRTATLQGTNATRTNWCATPSPTNTRLRGDLRNTKDRRNWRSKHPVLDVISERVRARGTADGKTDGYKLGLVVEGGGMRGITSAGMLLGLKKQEMDDVFDAVYGSSAGAINLTYFLAPENFMAGANIYTDHIANNRFIDLSRMLDSEKGRPVLDIDFLLDYVMEHLVPLDWDKVVKSNVPLKIAASSLNANKSVLLENFRDKQDLVECLRASASVPGIAGGPVYHRGDTLVDAMVFEPVPVWSAIDDGCTHVLTLSTKPKPEGCFESIQRMSNSVIRKLFMTPEYIDEDVYELAEKHSRASDITQKMLEASSKCSTKSSRLFGAQVFTVYPGAQPASSLCKDVSKLNMAKQEGVEAVEACFSAA